MKKILPWLFAALSALGPEIVCSGQDETSVKFRPYGFIANYMVFDSREVDADAQDMFFFMPQDVRMSGDVDENAVPSFRMLSLTSRLGLNVSGYRIGDLQVSGNIDGDFYCMSGSTATFRLRNAYMGLLWDNLVVGDLLLNVGQTWHPMAADMPHGNNVETGSPFNPYNWSPQVMFHWTVGKFTWTGGVLYPMQFLPAGPNGKSAEYNRYGMIPEIYLGASFKSGGFLGRAGVDFFSILPRWKGPVILEASIKDGERKLKYDTDQTAVLTSRLFAVSPFVYLQYTAGKFQVKAKSVLAQAGEHMNLLSGYGPTFDWNSMRLTYTPMQDWVSFVSFQFGRKFQVLGMLGYMERLGTTKKLFGYNDSREYWTVNAFWLNTVADTRIQKAFRATPTIAWNLGNLTVSLEYNCTAGWFGEGTHNVGGLYETGHWVLNHRIEQMVKFNF